MAGIFMGCVAIALCSNEPLVAVKYFLTGPFSSKYFFGNYLSYATPLIIAGAGACVAFSASVWNLGLEGQMFAGMLAGTYVAYICEPLPPLLAIVLSLAAAFAGGAFIGFISAILKQKCNVEVMMSSLLLSNAIVFIVGYILAGPFNNPNSGEGITSLPFNPDFMLTRILGKSDLSTGIFIAMGIYFVVSIGLRRYKKGFEITITGRNQRFAKYGGLKVASIASLALILSGGIVGTAGMVNILGVHGKMHALSSGFGWSGLSVAMISRNNPWMVIPVALFLAFIQKGAESAMIFSDISPDIAQILQAVVLLLATSELIYDFALRRKARKEEKSLGTKEEVVA
jgi:simple sugar transport system permease protein